jgi:hypothetical protein
MNYVSYREALVNGKEAAMKRLKELEQMCSPSITEEEWAPISNEMDDCIDAIVSFDDRIKAYDENVNSNICITLKKEAED